MATQRQKKEVPVDNKDFVPVGTPYSTLSPESIREEYTRVFGLPANDMSITEAIEALINQFNLEQVLIYQDEVYNELSKQND